MAAITEDYVSFETAKLLKEKGFPQEYDGYHSMVYNEEDYEDEYEVQRMVLETRIVKAGTLSSYPLGVPEPKCYCPTLQMAIKWLRKVYNIHVVPKFDFYVGDYTGRIYDGRRETAEEKDDYIAIIGNRTYEEAAEVAIKYCLENLI